ncbi:MAG: peptidylprolyl isomerase [Candidatus Omnitrophota bacterium]
MRFTKGLRFLAYVVLPCFLFSACVPESAAVVDKVIVVVNEEVLTQREFDRMFAPTKRNLEANFKGEELQSRLEMERKGLLEQLVATKLIISLAKKEKIEIDEEELQKNIGIIKANFKTEEEFLQELNAKGTNLTEFEREIREQMLAQKFVEKEVSSKIVIPPYEVRDLYDNNKEKLVAPDVVKVRGIMIRKNEGSSGDADRKKMEEIVGELKKGKDFATLASERSEGPYAKNAGDMGYIPRGELPPELEGVIFALKKGEISDIIESQVGYHVFLAEDVQQGRSLEFNEVSDYLKNELYKKKIRENMIKWIEEKRKNAYISYK